MKTLLKLEELAQLLVCTVTLWMHEMPWWGYLLLLVGPDVGMLGYVAGPRTGAFTYNLLHHKGMALAVAGIGIGGAYLGVPLGALTTILLPAGVILYGHACLDRLFGFGLKYTDGFAHTHLGWIGREGRPVEQ